MKKYILPLIIVISIGLTIGLGYTTQHYKKQAQACQSFAVASDKLVTLASDALTLSSDGILATADMDVEKMDEITRQFNELNPKIETAAQDYKEKRELCTGVTEDAPF